MTVLRLAILALSLILVAGTGLVGCAKTEAQKTEEAKTNADSAINEFKATANAIDAMGAPSASWSDDQFTKYEDLLKTFEYKAGEIKSRDGKDGVIIFGTYDLDKVPRFVSAKRDLVSKARAEKVVEVERKKNSDRYDVLVESMRKDVVLVKEPSPSQTDQEIADQIAILSRLEAGFVERQQLLAKFGKAEPEIEAAKTTLTRLQQTYKKMQEDRKK